MKITVGVLYYNQLEMLKYHLSEWLKYKDEAEFIIVDDCSLIPLKLPLEYSFVKVYRITDNINWNQTGARNLVYLKANNQWVFTSDIDHVLTHKSFSLLLNLLKDKKNENKEIYFLDRDFACGFKKGRMHSSFIIDKHVYLAIGGQDEDFAGNYGGVDQSFYKKSLKYLNYNWLSNIRVLNYSFCDFIKDANVQILDRNSKRNMALYHKKMRKGFPITKMIRFNWISRIDIDG